MSNIQPLLSSRSNEWYTPSIYVEAARSVMGSIDIDPASCKEANEVVKATTFYSIEANGLLQSLHGNVWCNPPYGTTNGKSNTATWIRKVLRAYEHGDIEQAILLTNSNTDTRWFHQLFAYPVCFTEGRINFLSPVHHTDSAFSRETSGHTHGSAFTYLGKNVPHFIEVFSQFGTVVQRVSAVKPKPLMMPELWT